jgi:uncharacterized protein
MSDQVESRPVVAGRRIGEVDSLRGFALFGILVTNVLVATMLFSFTVSGTALRPSFDGGVDRFVYAVMTAFFLGKFYLLFSFLFGYSFTLQIAAAQRAGVGPLPRLFRRCGALFLIGLAHVLFLWLGDILTLYAMLCLWLILLRRIRPRTALIAGVTIYFLFAVVAFLPGNDDGIAGLDNLFDLQELHTAYTGTFLDTFHMQLETGPKFMLFTWFGQGMPALGMFLIGMAAGKWKLFENDALLQRWIPRAMLLGFAVGLPFSVATLFFQTKNGEMSTFWYGMQELANPFMTLGYVAIVLWAGRSRWSWVTTHLAPAGRMAATNYIVQSVVLMVVYTGYGLALADRIPPAGVLGIALLTYAAQLWISAWWLRRYAYGPIEWLLRAATYRSIPMWSKTPLLQPKA